MMAKSFTAEEACTIGEEIGSTARTSRTTIRC
jgi:hypothetical protein